MGGWPIACPEWISGMNAEQIAEKVIMFRDDAARATREYDELLRHCVPMVAIRELLRLRKAEAQALKLQILSELYLGLVGDPGPTAAWLDRVIQSGEIEVLPLRGIC